MKLGSISGITLFTNDIAATAAFYEALGFRLDKQTENGITILLNWFWIRFEKGQPAEFRESINVRVVSVEEFHAFAKEHHILIETEPYEPSWASHAMTLKDPNGYLLTLFDKAK